MQEANQNITVVFNMKGSLQDQHGMPNTELITFTNDIIKNGVNVCILSGYLKSYNVKFCEENKLNIKPENIFEKSFLEDPAFPGKVIRIENNPFLAPFAEKKGQVVMPWFSNDESMMLLKENLNASGYTPKFEI